MTIYAALSLFAACALAVMVRRRRKAEPSLPGGKSDYCPNCSRPVKRYDVTDGEKRWKEFYCWVCSLSIPADASRS